MQTWNRCEYYLYVICSQSRVNYFHSIKEERKWFHYRINKLKPDLWAIFSDKLTHHHSASDAVEVHSHPFESCCGHPDKGFDNIFRNSRD